VLIPSAKVELVYQDETGSTAALTFNVPASSTVAAAASSANDLAAVVASITGCVLVRRRITYRLREDDMPSPEDGASITRRGVFYYAVDPPSPDGLVEIPGIKDSVFLTDGPTAGYQIDRDNADIIAFNDAVLAIGACNPFGDAFTALVIAILESRV